MYIFISYEDFIYIYIYLYKVYIYIYIIFIRYKYKAEILDLCELTPSYLLH